MNATADEHVQDMIPSEEVEKLLRVSRSTLYRWRKKGLIKFIEYPPRRYRYSRSEIGRILKKGFNNE